MKYQWHESFIHPVPQLDDISNISHMIEYINWHDINCTDCKKNIDQDSVNQYITILEIVNSLKDTTV